MARTVNLSRRGFLRGTGALLAAPAIVRVASLMPVYPFAVDASLYGDFNIHTELVAITRKALMPRIVLKMYSSVYASDPLCQLLAKNGNPA